MALVSSGPLAGLATLPIQSPAVHPLVEHINALAASLPNPTSNPFTPAFDLAHPNHESASSYAAHTLANQIAAARAAQAAAGGPQGAGQVQPIQPAPAAPHSTFLQLLTGGGLPTPNPNNDQMHTENVITHLMSALGLARDPELKTSLSQALAALQKHVATRAKEHQMMLQGKMSPRLMHEAYSNGQAHSGGSVL